VDAAADVSLVLVAHRSAAVLPGAVGAFRREAAELRLAAEVVVVEQSEDAAEAERAVAGSPDVLLLRPNRGYAAGVNAGIAAASGRLLLVGNPDVELRAGALRPLVAALDRDCDVAGPQLELAGVLFPPADRQTPLAELGRRRAGRSRSAWERHLRRELRDWDRVWCARRPTLVPALSGALLALSSAFAAWLGPWDEEYFLYFEETDWLRRARQRGARLAVVPGARAVHRWGHSAHPEEWGGRFAVSQHRFYRRSYGWLGAMALGVPSRLPWRTPWSPEVAADADRWLLSPSPAGFPAALVGPGNEVEAAARGFCAASGRADLTLVGINGGAGFVGPYAWQPTMRAS
jgi:N-acetylglucosaminyl-diphospho-decaprenol L-rhamnosyltransferase